ncbi:MAG: HAMP domain-containing protein [Acidobacteria bacterium]|nr:MAG: HAMP domain-containing protein [Acidobacteriota bacterium]
MTELSLLEPDTPPPAAAPRRRRPFTDNPRLIGLAVLILLGILLALFFLAPRTDQLRPEYISEAVLYALSSVCLALIVALVFVLARNLLKLWVEQKRALPFARFRAKLVAAMLAMTIVPAVLVLLIGSEIITSSSKRWFSTPAEELVHTARDMAQIVYSDRAAIVTARAERLALSLPPDALGTADLTVLQPRLAADLAVTSSGLVELYRVVTSAPGAPPAAVFVTSVGESSMSQNRAPASADRLATRVAVSGRAEQTQDQVQDGLLIRAAAPVRASGVVVGVVVATEALTGKLSEDARRMADAFSQYQQLSVLRVPLQGFYLTSFLMVTLLILISATWFGLFIAKRITRPVQMLAEGARAVGAGQLDLRIEPDSTDELGSLVESFNTMAAELRTSHERLDARRRYIETILERAATGVVSLSADGRVLTLNRAAASLLGLDDTAIGKPATEVFARHDLAALQPILDTTVLGKSGSRVEEITLASDEREVHLAVAATMLGAEGRPPEGAVVVFDDVTPLIRAERVAAWRDVARRLAHEIKNPLTPIQLSAERLQRNFATAPPNARALVEECTAAIITEVEALKGLVDEFAQFARMRGPKLAAADLNFLASDTLRLYAGVLQQGAIKVAQDLAPGIPRVRMDVEQMRQVLINLVDNAIDALGGASVGLGPDGREPRVAVSTSFDPATGMVRLTVADNGPGVPAADRDKLFLPYYSTKGRGSGLGLAIVGRIITEHGGTVTVTDAQPRGAQFMIDLPAA